MKDKMKISISAYRETVSWKGSAGAYCSDVLEKFCDLLIVTGYARESINKSILKLAQDIQEEE